MAAPTFNIADLFEQAVDEVASLAAHHLAKGDQVGLVVVTSRVRTWIAPAGGAAHRVRLASALASFVQSLVFLTSFRVVMTIVYERTRSVLVSQILHFSLTASSILVAPSTSPAKMLIWNSLWPLTLAGVAMVFVAARAATHRVRHA